MDIKDIIFTFLKTKGTVTTADVVGKTGFSRAHAQMFLKNLAAEGKIVRLGKANQAHYILASKRAAAAAKPSKVRKIIANRELAEDKVLSRIKEESSIFQKLPGNVSSIIDYAFTEMLNNAIEHSESDKIDVLVTKTATDVRFSVADRGVGIFNNIREKKRLASTMDAIQDLLKGKETTAPEAHSGEGIFFTSKIADFLTLKSFGKKVVFDNIGQDIYIKDIQSSKGTKVDFVLGLKSKKILSDLFNQYTDESLQFNKTGVKVKLYNRDVDYVSRSQARRILAGLDKFQTIELDFHNVETIGQAFADEVFRVWQTGHRDIKITIKNANENILFMIKRAQA
ncbi:MAG: histidine kinase [Deltaproteobacteria bacterium HGW-Deltaproteobacteria-12]|jgi:anti-sigma regulatory factor (Ser/Thr protein kinase)|nr:MAG: histidine kinase [Deltaproteobacteria bacterium HGW-Deltaproteobacteria-12]